MVEYDATLFLFSHVKNAVNSYFHLKYIMLASALGSYSYLWLSVMILEQHIRIKSCTCNWH